MAAARELLSWRVVAVAVIVAIVSGWVLTRGARSATFHGDESGWISSGIYYWKLLDRGDFGRERWDCPECRSWGTLNPPLGKLSIGLPYLSCLGNEACEFNRYYDFTVSRAENERRGTIPSRPVLLKGRYSAAAAGVLACLAVFALAYVAGGRSVLAGVLAAALILASDLFRVSASRAMTDAAYNFLLLTEVLAAAAIIGSRNITDLTRLAAVAGVCVGLASSVKVSGYVIGLPLVLFAFAYRFGSGRDLVERNQHGLIRCVAIFGIVAFSILVALNPTFWPTGPADAWRLVGPIATLSAWDRYMASQAELGLGEWTASRFVDIHSSIFVEHASLAMDVLFVVGAIVLVRRALSSLRSRIPDPGAIALAYFLINYFVLVLFLRLNWDRYYLPIHIAMAVIAGVGGAWAVRVIGEWRASRIRVGSAESASPEADPPA
jgi:hypothetical protein